MQETFFEESAMKQHVEEMLRLFNLLRPNWKEQRIWFSDDYGCRMPEDFTNALKAENAEALTKMLTEQNASLICMSSDWSNIWVFVSTSKPKETFDYPETTWVEWANAENRSDTELTMSLETGEVFSMCSPTIRKFVNLMQALQVPPELQAKTNAMLFKKTGR